MIIVPVGIDCGVADALNKLSLRGAAFPFDWNVTYSGVADIIKNDFDNFVPINRFGIQKNNTYSSVYNKYNVLFIHEDWLKQKQDEQKKYYRRIERFQELLKSDNDTVYFIRKGHMFHHHAEYYFKDDFECVRELSTVLKEKFPNLKYKIFLILCCPSCYDINKNYELPCDNVYVINNSKNVNIQTPNDNLCNCIINDVAPLMK